MIQVAWNKYLRDSTNAHKHMCTYVEWLLCMFDDTWHTLFVQSYHLPFQSPDSWQTVEGCTDLCFQSHQILFSMCVCECLYIYTYDIEIEITVFWMWDSWLWSWVGATGQRGRESGWFMLLELTYFPNNLVENVTSKTFARRKRWWEVKSRHMWSTKLITPCSVCVTWHCLALSVHSMCPHSITMGHLNIYAQRFRF